MTPALLVVGLSHATAPVEVRERLAVPDAALPETLGDLLAATGLAEGLLLTTCNRVEVWGVARTDADGATVARWLGERAGPDVDGFGDLVYVRQGLEALAHMTRVAASLDSMVVGEAQILGQVRSSHAAAGAAGTAGPVLGEAVGHALRIARRVRTETEVGRGAVSVGYAAVELARKIFGDLRERAVVLVGAGEMGTLAARHLADLGVRRLVVASRTLEHAEEVARATGGKAVAFDEFARHAATADIVICAATAPGLVRREDVEAWVGARPRPFFLIDLGVPRNVEREVSRVADVYLYDVDDLQGVIAANREARARALDRARALVADAVRRVDQRHLARSAAPTIRSLRAKLEEIRLGEVERAAGRLRGAQDPRAVLEAMSVALVNKILHGPIEQLKAAQGGPAGGRLRALVRELFGLTPDPDPEDPDDEEAR